MPAVTIDALNEALEAYYQAACEESNVQPVAAPVATRRSSDDSQGFNWDGSFRDGSTKDQAMKAFASARAAGWRLN